MEQNEIKAAFASLAKDRSKREELAQLLTEYIQPNHLSSSIMNLFLNTRQLNLGDALVKKVRRGIEVRKLVPGSVHLASEVTVSDRINYTLEGADVKVNYNLWEMEAGDIGTVADLQAEMRAKLSDYYIGRTFTALSTIWNGTNTPTNYTNVGAALTASALKNAIDTINLKVGKVKAVVGTRKALTPITTFGAGWALPYTNIDGVAIPEALSEIYRTGWLGQYYGAPIVALNQVYNNAVDYTAMLPETKVLVIGENAGEFILYGPSRDKAYEDMAPTPPQFYLETYQQFGLIVDNAQGIYVLDVV
jgi:hypothetical protein